MRLCWNEPGAVRRFLTAFCLLAVMCLAVFLRIKGFPFSGNEAYPSWKTDKYGTPYFIEMDAYYHVRIGDEIAEYGFYGQHLTAGGTRWDYNRFAPEGRSAVYPQGMIRLSIWFWKILKAFGGADLHTVMFYMSCIMVIPTILIVFLLGRSMAAASGAEPVLTGICAALLVSCAPVFVQRTFEGTYDTDMMQIPMTALLLYAMLRLLLTDSMRAAAGYGIAAAAASALYTTFWPRALAFSCIAFGGGALILLLRAAGGSFREQRAPYVGYLVSAACTVLLIRIIQGPSYIRNFLRSALSVSVKAAMPNRYTSIAEMRAPAFAPGRFTDWFSAYLPGQNMTVVNGIGGAAAGAAAVLCLLVLAVNMLGITPVRVKPNEGKGDRDRESTRDDRSDSEMVVFILCGVWFAACLYALKLGTRFIEHFSVPVGMLASDGIGMAAEKVRRVYAEEEAKLSARVLKYALPVCALACAVLLPSVRGGFLLRKEQRGSVSKSAEEAMDYIALSSENADAVIVSWWDLGYYYEYASGHPVLWDGGSQDVTRAVVLGKALVSEDLRLSASLLRMLASTGNAVPRKLTAKLGAKEGLNALYELILEDKETVTAKLLETGFSEEEAADLESRMHPSDTKEVYLVLSRRMMDYLGWIEYYGNWDFDGDNPVPVYVGYSMTPDGTADIDSGDPEAAAFFAQRSRETIWRLFLEEEGRSGGEELFAEVYSAEDPEDVTQVWLVR